jgi:ACS family hexuronate transporter-like MFS transporter
VVAPLLRDQFRMSNTEYSYAVFAFMMAYTIMNGVSGRVIDKLGSRRGFIVIMICWSAAAMAHSLVVGVFSLAFCRLLLGAGEAGNWPAGVKVVAEWFPVRERAFASGIFNSGSAIGAVIAPPLVAAITTWYGWRAAFLMVGSVGFVWLLAWIALYQVPDRHSRISPEELTLITEGGRVDAREAGPQAGFWRLFSRRFVWALTLSKIFLDPVWYFYIFWFPEYLKRVRGFDLAEIGMYGWITFLTADLGNLAGGWLSGRLIRAGWSVNSARKGTITLFAAMMTAAIPAVLTPNVWLALALVSCATMGYTGCNANILALPSDVFPRNSVSTVFGIASMGSGFGGMLFTLTTGIVVDHYSYEPIFFAAGVMPVICVILLWTLVGRITPMSREELIGPTLISQTEEVCV